MRILVIYNGRPIYATNDTVVDWWKVGQGLEKHSSYTNDINEYRRAIDAFKSQMILGYDLSVWTWNKLMNDWIEA